MKKIVFSGGGTGGHIYPALAIRESLMKTLHNKIDSVYIGLTDGMEAKIVDRIDNLPFLSVRAQGMPRKLSFKWLTFPFINFFGILDAISHLKKFSPDIVVTTGGYVAFPVLMASRLLGIPAIIHEQNAAMGITNRIFASGAKKVLLSYPEAATVDNEQVIHTGNPVRSAFINKTTSSNRFEKQNDEFWLLAVGGSRGALSINKTCIDLANKWLPNNSNIKLLHISGDRDYEMVKEATMNAPDNYILLPYLHEMKEAFDVADLIISRAGATILSEIGVCGKPAILIPFPYATDNHQEKNARVLEKSGAAKLILDSNLNYKLLAETVESIKTDKALHNMATAMQKSRPKNVEDEITRQIISCL